MNVYTLQLQKRQIDIFIIEQRPHFNDVRVRRRQSAANLIFYFTADTRRLTQTCSSMLAY